jgi:hypothetical protein
MKLAIAAMPWVESLTWRRPTSAALHKAAGLLIAAGVPTLFWTLAVRLAAKGLGIAVAASALTAFSVIVAAWCLVSAALVMSNRQ